MAGLELYLNSDLTKVCIFPWSCCDRIVTSECMYVCMYVHIYVGPGSSLLSVQKRYIIERSYRHHLSFELDKETLRRWNTGHIINSGNSSDPSTDCLGQDHLTLHPILVRNKMSRRTYKQLPLSMKKANGHLTSKVCKTPFFPTDMQVWKEHRT